MHEVTLTSVNMNKNQTELYIYIMIFQQQNGVETQSNCRDLTGTTEKMFRFFLQAKIRDSKRFAERQLLRMKLQQLKWSSFGLPRCFVAMALTRQDYTDGTNHLPICSMYGIFTTIYPINGPNVGKYTIHGAYGLWILYYPVWMEKS